MQRINYRQARRGFSAAEAIAAIGTLAVLLAIAGQMNGTLLRHRRSLERHRTNADAKANLMAMMMSLPYDKVTQEHLETMATELSLAHASWELSLETVPMNVSELDETLESRAGTSAQALNAKRIVIAVRNSIESNSTSRNPPLIAWKYRVQPGESDTNRDSGNTSIETTGSEGTDSVVRGEQ